MMLGTFKVYRLAYRLYFQQAPWRMKLSCALRILKNRLGKIRAPIAVMIGVTHRCQCKCAHCGMELFRGGQEAELTLAEVASIIRQARELGAVEITLFGGEALLRDDLADIVRAAREARMLCSLDSNGLLLTPSNIRRLKDAGLCAVKISLDSSSSEEHDANRGVPGCFDKVLAAVRECAAQRLPCVISTCATRENIRSGDMKKLIELGRRTGATAVRIIDTTLSGCSLSAPDKLLSTAERKELAGLLEPGFVFLENLASSKALTHPICSALARRYIYVSPLGDVQPCCFVPVSFGNLRRETLQSILNRLWSSALMRHDSHQCLMNNPAFREQFVPAIKKADNLPIAYDTESSRENVINRRERKDRKGVFLFFALSALFAVNSLLFLHIPNPL